MSYDPEDRRGTIGASDLPILLGLSPYADASPWSILHRSARPDTPAQATGRSLEAWLVAQVKPEQGYTVPNETVFCRDGWAHATPDGLAYLECFCDILCKKCDAPRAVVEAKNVSWAKAADWREGVPAYVYAQVQWQMWVTGAPMATVSALVAGEYQRHDVPRDEAFLAEAVPIASAFWADTRMGIDPGLDASHACGAALKARLAGTEDAAPVPATLGQFLAWAACQELRALAKSSEAAARLRSAELLQSMRGPILLPDGRELRSTAQGLRARKARV